MFKLIFSIFISFIFVNAQTTPTRGLSSKPVKVYYYKDARIKAKAGSQKLYNSMIVRDNRIEDIGNDLKIPADARVINTRHAFIYPGFVEPYMRYGIEELKKEKRKPGPNPTIDRSGKIYWNAAVKAQRSGAAEFVVNEEQAKELRTMGFTTVMTNGLDGIFQGSAATVSLRSDIPNKLILHENSAQFLSFSKGSSTQDYPSSLMGSIALIRQVFYDAKWYSRAWKAFENNMDQKRPEKNSALDALQAVLDKKRKVVFGAGSSLNIVRAGKIATEFNLDFIYKGGGDSYKWLEEISALKAPLIVPVNFPETPFVSVADYDADVSLAQLKSWDTAPENPARLSKAGVKFAFTTDGLKKKDKFIKNIRLAIQRGLDKETALAALTQIPAEIAGVQNMCGTLEKNKLANFVICDKDIFEEGAEIKTVVVEGQVYELNKYKEFDVRGDWELLVLISENYPPLKMNISGTLNKPMAKFFSDSVEIPSSHFSLFENKLSYSLKSDTLGLDGILRFSGRVQGDIVDGHVILPDGQLIPWSAERKKEYIVEKIKNKESKSESVLFATVYPDKAYGRSNVPEQVQIVAITNATIWTAAEKGILENADLLIEKGRIKKVGKNLSIPGDALKIDGTGLHVTPGIIDEHSHIAISRGVNEGSQAITSEVRIGDVLNPENINIYRQLAGGVTMSQLLHGSANPIGGQAQVIKLRWGQNSDGLKYSKAPPSIKFALGENVKQSNWGDYYTKRYPQTRMGVREIIKDGFQRARSYEEEWKEYNALSGSEKAQKIPPRKDLELEALVEILNSKRFIHCHSYVQSEILMLMNLAEDFGFMVGTFTHILEGYKVAREMAEHGAMASSFADWWDYKFEVYEAIPYNTALMVEQGVVTSVNSDDAEMARRLNQEAAKAIKYGGLSREEAIKLVTINAAKQLKVDQYTGSLEAGKEADFVIWKNDPLSIYAQVEQTWIEGRKYFDREEDKKLRRIIHEQRTALIQKALKADADGSKKLQSSPEGGFLEKNDYRCDDIFDYMEEVN